MRTVVYLALYTLIIADASAQDDDASKKILSTLTDLGAPASYYEFGHEFQIEIKNWNGDARNWNLIPQLLDINPDATLSITVHPGGTKTDEWLKALSPISSRVRDLSVMDSASVTEESATFIKKMTNLEHLWFGERVNVGSDETIADALSGKKRLKVLMCPSGADQKTIDAISKLKSLWWLYIRTPIKGNLDGFENHGRLKDLRIVAPVIGGQLKRSIEKLSKNKNLKSLLLTDVDPQTLDLLSSFAHVEELKLNDSKIRDHLSLVCKLKHLKSIHFYECDIGKSDLKMLLSLPDLTKIDFSDCESLFRRDVDIFARNYRSRHKRKLEIKFRAPFGRY